VSFRKKKIFANFLALGMGMGRVGDVTHLHLMRHHEVGEQFKALGKLFTVVQIVKKDLLRIQSECGEVYLKCGRFYSKVK